MTPVDAVVVGSGFGGAVCAARLAQAGLSVCVLERGRWWGIDDDTEGDATPRRPFPRGMGAVLGALRNVRVNRGRLRRNIVRDVDGLYELHLHRHLDLLTASGVGGGSLVYTNMQVEPDAAYFDAFPPDLRAGEMQPYYDRVRDVLRPAPIAPLPPKNRAFEDALAGVPDTEIEYPDLAVVHGDPDAPESIVNAAGRRQSACNWCGNCVLGCMETAKTTLDLTYIPLAIDAGAELRTGAEVEVIAPVDTGPSATAPGRAGWDVRYLDHDTGRRRRVQGRRLVIAAGTLGTLRLLFAARDRFHTLRDIGDGLGRNFSANADQAALLRNTDYPAARDRGPSVNAFIRRRDTDGRHRYLAGEAGIPATGLRLPAQTKAWLDSAQLVFYMGADRSNATVRFDGDALDIDQANSLDPEVFEAIDAETRALARAFGADAEIGKLSLARGADANLSVHPLGGASLADTPDAGVCNTAGNVFGVENLYVADGSLYPKAPGLPPSMTIAALAERIADLLTKE